MKRISSLDYGYQHGQLSVFPQATDNPLTLYEVRNNAESTLKQTISSNSKYLILEDASNFPSAGLVKITNKSNLGEVIFYGRKVNNQLHLLQRGFSGYRQNSWQAGSKVTSPVMAEHHNALKDAIMQIERKIGLVKNPEVNSLNWLLTKLEQKWLAPKVSFRAFPKIGPPPLTVHFHNFSSGHGVNYLWDFGDNSTSTSKNVNHTFINEGTYTIKLNMISSTGSQGKAEKPDYIRVNKETTSFFFYGEPLHGYSRETGNATEFSFVDQSDGTISERHWFFSDDEEITISNPNIHVAKHIFDKPGEYSPTLMVRMKDGNLKKSIIMENIIVI